MTLLALSVYCLIALLIAERRAANPLLLLQHFRNHVFSSAIASNGILHMTMLGIFFLTPFFMERGLHLSTTHVAILLTSQQFYNVSLPHSSAGDLREFRRKECVSRLDKRQTNVRRLACRMPWSQNPLL